MAEKFGGGTRSREIGNEIEEIGTGQSSSQSISDIRKKYERKLAVHQDSGTEVCIINCLLLLCKVCLVKIWNNIRIYCHPLFLLIFL